jgi:very-short-patch-repair endonuclease
VPHLIRLTSEESAAPTGAVPSDLAAARLAARQFGVITYEQLLSCGLSPDRVDQRVRAGQLQRLWRGVYAFGHRELRREGHLVAAVLACGPGAVLSDRSAAHHWELLNTAQANTDVTLQTRAGRARRKGIRLHCVRRLDHVDVTIKDGIPITTVARTVVDLNAVVPDRFVERALEQAYIRRLVPLGAIEDALKRANGRKTRTLRRLIAAEHRTATITHSELEERFLTLIRSSDLPDPELNVRLCGYEVDFLWRAQHRVIEVDGHAYHSTRHAASRDRRKDNDLEMAGFRVTRFTADQVMDDPEDTLERARRVVLGQ